MGVYGNKKEKKYYFLSENDMNEKVLQPRIPNNYMTKNGYEDNKTKRVCFAPSINQCLMGLSMNLKDKEFYVHIPDPEIDIKKLLYKPSIKEVPDSKITGEVWIKVPIKIICTGKILVTGDAGEPGIPYTYGNGLTAELYKWNWKWIERND